MGGDEIDLREAEIEGGELTLNLVAVMGGATLYIPDSVQLDVGGFSLMGGKHRDRLRAPAAPRRPVIKLRTWNLEPGRRHHLPGPAAGPAAWA